jgi:MurNAc alpha-1-phosphate uridylyltransferase
VFAEIDFSRLKLQAPSLAHLVMVNNPPQHAQGDFALNHGKLSSDGENKLTFSGVGIYEPNLFADIEKGQPAKLAPILRAAMLEQQVSGEHYQGIWHDIGTPERLSALNQELLEKERH